nr:helix-turn-helix transcriptional regulator [Pseudomonas promysalinigenes]
MGLRQADLAKLAGISLRAIRHLEGGRPKVFRCAISCSRYLPWGSLTEFSNH